MSDSQLNHILSAANGYLELGMVAEAEEEISQVPPTELRNPLVLEVQAEIFRCRKRWDFMRAVSLELVDIQPEDIQNFINLAYATRRAVSLEDARAILKQAEEKFSDEPILHFNLACYACQLGNLDEARDRLKRAIRLNGIVRTLALEDEDLKPLWPEISPRD